MADPDKIADLVADVSAELTKLGVPHVVDGAQIRRVPAAGAFEGDLLFSVYTHRAGVRFTFAAVRALRIRQTYWDAAKNTPAAAALEIQLRVRLKDQLAQRQRAEMAAADARLTAARALSSIAPDTVDVEPGHADGHFMVHVYCKSAGEARTVVEALAEVLESKGGQPS